MDLRDSQRIGIGLSNQRAAAESLNSDELEEHRRRWRRESYLRFGVISGVALILWAGLGGLPTAVVQGPGPDASLRLLRVPILEEGQALAIISTILTIIAALSVTLVLGARLDEMNEGDLVRIGGWFDAAVSSMTLMAALAIALAGSLLVTHLNSGGAWVAGVLALACLLIVGSTLGDRIGLERRGAFGAVDLVRQERMRRSLVRWGLTGSFPRGKLAVVSIAVPLVSSALTVIPAAILEPESLAKGYWVWAPIAQLFFWVLAGVYIFTASAIVWLLRALERPSGARIARIVSTLGVGIFAGPPFVSSWATDTVGFWLIYIATPFAAVVALSYLPQLGGFNPYYWAAWMLLPPAATEERRNSCPDESVQPEGGGSSTSSVFLVAASVALVMGAVGVALAARRREPLS